MPKIITVTAEVSSQIDLLFWQVPINAIPLKPPCTSVVFTYAHALIAAVLQRIGVVDPEAAGQLHEPAGTVRRWSLSPLWRNGAEWFFQIAIPSDPLADMVLRALQMALPPYTSAEPVLPVTITFTGAAVTGDVSWAQMMSHNHTDKWCLYFLTPTAMAMPGGRSKIQLPLPLPSALLETWRRVWNQHCPNGCAIEEDVVTTLADHLAISSFTGGTAMVEIPVKGYLKPFIGFTGQAEFALLEKKQLTPELITMCQALMRFAPYSGTGKKTAWGMGWVTVQ